MTVGDWLRLYKYINGGGAHGRDYGGESGVASRDWGGGIRPGRGIYMHKLAELANAEVPCTGYESI